MPPSWMAFQRHPGWRFNGLLTALREFPAQDRRQNPVLSVPSQDARFEHGEYRHEELYHPDGLRRSHRWKRDCRDAWRRLVLTRVGCPERLAAHRHDGGAGIAVRPLLVEELIRRPRRRLEPFPFR